jgi:rod shape-determining protein MreD
VRRERLRLLLVLGLLVVLQFTVRSRLGDERVTPDFLLLALLIYAIRARPGAGAAAGCLVGLLGDALTPGSFGAGALAHTLVGYALSWAKAVVFAENLAVTGVLFLVATWLRNMVLALASGRFAGPQLVWVALVWSPLQGLTTAVAGVLVLLVFRNWLPVRVGQS